MQDTYQNIFIKVFSLAPDKCIVTNRRYDMKWEHKRDNTKSFSSQYAPGLITIVESMECYYNPKFGENNYGVRAWVSDGWVSRLVLLRGHTDTESALEAVKYTNFLDW